MSTTNRKPRVLAALIALFLLALAVGCRGFFVNPVLTSITVGPSGQNVEQGKTLQMSARGTYDDGSVKNLTTGVSWNSSDTDVATISTSGLVQGVSAGTSTVTASADTISGTATVTVVITGVTKVTISPSSAHGAQGNTLPFTCAATTSTGNVDVTTSAQWTVSDTTNLTLSTGSNPVTVQIGSAAPNGGYSVTCSYTVGGTTFQSTAPINVP
ncbi:MAG TPA: Ig-like domain-containing protein [Terriglobales bacterium]|jgi:trimeric autotransporter adhesin|nr:Ig-like domain-containing protein [Terriglobales bacterium]